jgi:hypothetical protein
MNKVEYIIEICELCGGDIPAWKTDNKLWLKYHDSFNLLCPDCFMWLAKSKGYDPLWELKPK